mgnify:FL=1
MEITDLSRNNELAKPISQNNDNIYYTDNLHANGYEMDNTARYQNAQDGVAPKQIIIVDSADNVDYE